MLAVITTDLTLFEIPQNDGDFFVCIQITRLVFVFFLSLMPHIAATLTNKSLNTSGGDKLCTSRLKSLQLHKVYFTIKQCTYFLSVNILSNNFHLFTDLFLLFLAGN